ncbi:taste receptor, type 2, member 201, tandem duplicate 1, partial [Silurus meridionalis]
MDTLTFALVNIPVSAITSFMNFFFVFCMVFPQQGKERLRQPLNVLLGLLVGGNITLQICIFLYIVTVFYVDGILVFAVIAEMLFFTMRTSVTSSLWLNVFYYCQIVPAQCSVFIFLKRNIRIFIYSSIIAEKIFFLLGFSGRVEYIVLCQQQLNTASNTTPWHEIRAKMMKLDDFLAVEVWLQCAYLLLCLFVMLTSSCVTILYLQKHMDRMKESSSSFSSPCLQKQMRVTITGVLQTFIYFLCLTWMIVRELLQLIFYEDIDNSSFISCTIICFYSFGTTFNLGVGQQIFRQHAFKGWQKCLQTLT